MDVLVMCGGRGTRLDAPVEKPLYEVAGRPMIDWVFEAVDAAHTDRIHAAVSKHTPETKAHLTGRCELIETAGEGYVADLSVALDGLSKPVLTVSADLPLLEPAVVDRICAEGQRRGGSLAVCVPVALKRELGATIDTEANGLEPTGLNIVDSDDVDSLYVSYDARLAVNVNRESDGELAAALHPARHSDGSTDRTWGEAPEETDGS